MTRRLVAKGRRLTVAEAWQKMADPACTPAVAPWSCTCGAETVEAAPSGVASLHVCCLNCGDAAEVLCR